MHKLIAKEEENMKKKFALILLAIPLLLMGGCNEKTFDYSALERDNYNTGGNLTFVYDQITRTATFGGEGETVQFYSQDIAKGWEEEGCRVGVQLLIPKEVKDYKSATAVLDEDKLTAEDFVVQIGDEPQYALFQPIVSQEKSQVELKITWQEGYKEQTYLIVISDGTNFMTNDFE